MADTAIAGPFSREAAAPYPFDLARVTAVAARGIQVAGMDAGDFENL